MPRLSEYAFTPRDVGHFVGWLTRRIRRATWYDWLGAALLMCLWYGLRTYTELTFDDVFFWLFGVWVFWFGIDARVSIGGALVGLICIPLLSLATSIGFPFGEPLSELVAVWVYFFLAIGVLKQVWDTLRSPTIDEAEEGATFQTRAVRAARTFLSRPAPHPTRPHTLIIPELPHPPLHGSPTPRPSAPLVGDGVIVTRRRVRRFVSV